MTNSPVNAYDAAKTAMEAAWQQAQRDRVWNSYDDEITGLLDALLAAREHTTCLECRGHGHGAEQYAERGIGFSYPTCPTCGGSGSVPGSRLIDALAVFVAGEGTP